MRILFLLGWVLMIVAFFAAGAEVAATALPAGPGGLVGVGDLWRVLAPDSYLNFRIRLHETMPWLWPILSNGPLAVPGWLLFGLPGVLLAWFCRPGRHITEDEKEDLERRRDSLFLYDELAREARRQAEEDGYDPGEDDNVPSHYTHDVLEEAERVDVEVDEHILKEIRHMDGRTPPAEETRPPDLPPKKDED